MAEWRAFIEGMRVTTPSGANDTALRIQQLTIGQPPPLGRFWRRVAFETRLIDPRANAGAGAQAGAASLGQRAITRLRSSTVGRALVAGGTAQANAPGTGGGRGFGSIINARDVQTAFTDFIEYGVPARQTSSNAPQTTNLDLWHEDLDRVRQAIVHQNRYRTPLRTARRRVQGQISDIDTQWRQALTNMLLPPLSGIN
jgi:type VI protein secretion system component VasK